MSLEDCGGKEVVWWQVIACISCESFAATVLVRSGIDCRVYGSPKSPENFFVDWLLGKAYRLDSSIFKNPKK